MTKTLLYSAFAVGMQISVTAQPVNTIPVGFNTVSCLPNSDTYCSVPFAQSWDFQGVVAGTPSISGDAVTITPQGTVSWTADQFANLFFVRMLTGAKAGMYFQITGNAVGSLTIDLAGADFAGVGDGDGFAVSKFWTLSTLFPPATQTTIVPSLNTLGNGRRTEVLIPDKFSDGTNLAPTRKFFLHGTAWKEATTGFPASDNFILAPDSYFIVRHNNAAITSATTFTATGIVELNPVAIPLATGISSKQDNPVLTGRPVPVKLKDLDLISSGAFVASTNTLGNGRRDELLVFDNSVAAVNRSPSAIYFYNNATSNWRQATTGFPVADDVEIGPSSGILIRKYQADGLTTVWKHEF